MPILLNLHTWVRYEQGQLTYQLGKGPSDALPRCGFQIFGCFCDALTTDHNFLV